jgi:hypothetical protein
MKKVLKELLWTLLAALLMGQAVVFVLSKLSPFVPLRPEQRTIFFLGIILFSLVFRLLIHVREGSK